MRVLVADDSRVMRLLVIRTIRQAGYDWEVLEAPDGRAALDLALAEGPDLILSDWNMPQLTGLELLRSLRAAGSAIPFGFVTSEGSPQMRDQAAAAGAAFLLAKPFSAESLSEALGSVLA